MVPATKTRGLAIEVLASARNDGAVVGRLPAKMSSQFSMDSSFPRRPSPQRAEREVEAGTDPRAALREERGRASMTVAWAHERYVVAVRSVRDPWSSSASGSRVVAFSIANAPASTRLTVSKFGQ